MIQLDTSWLQHVQKPARYTGGEYNSIVKDHSTVDVTMALAFPDVYEVAMSHLGIKILYGLVNRREDAAAESDKFFNSPTSTYVVPLTTLITDTSLVV